MSYYKSIVLEAIIFEPVAKNIPLNNNTSVTGRAPELITEAAFEALFRSSFRELVIYACSLLNDQPAAEEIVQQVFYKVWEKRADMVFDTSPKAYLYKSVYHDCLNLQKHLKVKKAYARHIIQTGTDASIGQVEMADKELGRRIQAAINSLPGQCRIIFQMSRFEELKYREIADRLQLSVKTVEAQMGKALKQLRKLLGDYITPLLVIITSIIHHQ